MSVQVQHRRGVAANIATFTPAQGEIVVDTTNNRMIVGDGTTVGGWPAAKLSEVSVASRTAVSDANYTALTTDKNIAYTAITAARTVSLPSAASFPVGTRLTVFDESGSASAANTITIARAGSDTIDGGTSAVISSAYGIISVESNGSNKWTVTDQATSNLAAVGVGTAADPSNVLSVYGASALFNGTNFSFTVNKAASGDVASIIFEDGFSLRAQIGLLNNDNFTFKVSPNGSTYYTGLTLDSGTGSVTLGNARTPVADANYTALSTDREVAYTAITAARTVTLPAASAFPAGHALVIVDESGSVSLTNTVTIGRAGSDTIGGKASATIMSAYGYCRLLSNGSNAWVVAGRSCNIQTFSSSGTYTPTPGITQATVILVPGGGGGGGGALQAASNAVSGGGSGAGGGIYVGSFSAAAIGASQAVTIGAGGTAGAAATSSNTAGGAGGQGGSTSLGSLATIYGGGGGSGGQLAAASAGGGGGGLFAVGGSASGSTAGTSISGGAGGSGAAPANVSNPTGGGGGAGGSATGASTASGYVAFAAGAGGSGAGITSGNATAAGGNSGNAAGANTGVSGGAAGAAGTAGQSPTLSTRDLFRFAGSGGGGGGSSLTAAGAGGQGGIAAGGGGGGSAQNGGAAGAGGQGGAGFAIIEEIF